MSPLHWLYTIPLRLRSLVRRGRVEQELDEELRFHLEQQIEHQIARGADAREARRQALLSLNGLEHCKQECRDTRRLNLFDDLVKDIVYAARTLRKAPAFSLTAVLTVALGVGANTAVFSVFKDFLLRPLPFRDAGRLVTVAQFNPTQAETLTGYTSPPNYLDWRSQNRVFEDMGAWDGSMEQFNLTGTDEPERVRGKLVSSSFFSVLGARPLLGRLFGPEQDRRGGETVAVLSYSLWQRRFGGRADAIGRQITLEGRPVTVIGVMPAGFRFSAPPDEVWLPLGRLLQGGRGGMHLKVIGRLRTGVTLAQAQREMTAIAARLAVEYPRDNRNETAVVAGLRNRYVQTLRPALVVLLAAVGLVLVIACANVAAVSLARAAARQREMAVRRALGASKGRVARQTLTESVLLALAGGALGLVLAMVSVPLLYAAVPAQMRPLEPAGVDGWALSTTLAVSILTGLLFGLAPAWSAADADIQLGLKEGASGGTRRLARGRLRKLLVISETALAVMLLVGAGLLMKSLAKLLAVDSGFRAEHVLTMNLSHGNSAHTFYTEVLRRVAALPGVRAAGAANYIPIGENHWGQDIYIEGQPPRAPGDFIWAAHRSVSLDYFRTMGIRLLEGRHFAEEDLGRPVALVNEAMARSYWPGEHAIGKRFKIGALSQNWISVIGVIGNVKHQGLDKEVTPEMYFFESMPRMTLVIRAETDPAGLVSTVRKAIWSVDRNQPIAEVRTMERIVAESVAPRRVTMVLTAMFAGLALLLAGVGLYGLVSYSVALRRRDIGIRMALGARPGDIVRTIVREGMAIAVVGAGLGLAGAWALARVIGGLLFGVAVHDGAVFVAVPLVLVGAMAPACYWPARRAARMDPVEAVRGE